MGRCVGHDSGVGIRNALWRDKESFLACKEGLIKATETQRHGQ